MRKLIIDRNTWLRGEGLDVSALLREVDNKMCCLGSYALQLAGKKPEDILGKKEPKQCVVGDEWGGLVEFRIRTQPSGVYADSSTIANELMNFNDDTSSAEHEREADIKGAFLTIGVEVEFIN
jgi:hypothetical protein